MRRPRKYLYYFNIPDGIENAANNILAENVKQTREQTIIK